MLNCKLYGTVLGIYNTEKTVRILGENQITFVVKYGVSKYTIKYTVEKLFNFKVLSISTVNVKEKFLRKAANIKRYRHKWKKAVVTIHKEDF